MVHPWVYWHPMHADGGYDDDVCDAKHGGGIS